MSRDISNRVWGNGGVVSVDVNAEVGAQRVFVLYNYSDATCGHYNDGNYVVRSEGVRFTA